MLDGEGYYIDNEGIACTLVTINKVRLLAIGILSKKNWPKKITPILNVKLTRAKN